MMVLGPADEGFEAGGIDIGVNQQNAVLGLGACPIEGDTVQLLPWVEVEDR